MANNKLTYMLYGGSLLGSYRHHGFIPWDDDFDVFMPLSQTDDFRRIFDCSERAHGSVGNLTLWSTRVTHLWKVYRTGSIPFRRYPWAWPFIDVYFYTDNGGLISDVTETHEWRVMNKRDIFPLIKVPFEELRLPCPRNWYRVVDFLFTENVRHPTDWCQILPWNHKLEISGRRGMHRCALLKYRYPFVRRACVDGTVVESLMIGDETLRNWTYVKNSSGSPIDPSITCA
ncbi:ribitol 5-phosphate transferase FKRP-like [Tubulanus polymorphus]|uniref:ribitol 5-phosphate transferase FKRP-like n=1 Tax=Tubulanus polymorphus TaxID=672921 RepID=UPI003DA3AB27